MASYTYTTRAKEKRYARCSAMRAAKERKRLAIAAECGTWTMRLCQFEASFSPCGRYVGLRAMNGSWHRCASERAVRGAMAKVLWGNR